MTETFYGPWRVVLTRANSHFSQRMLIEGSDNSDGEYRIAFGQDLEVDVDGAEWRLTTQFFPFGGPSWLAGDVRRSTRYEPFAGLIVQLDGASRPPGSGSTSFTNLTLHCSCLDPETNPISAPNPYDFTIPERG
jgi:hypothetical protein